jgi:hypothetical protein
MGRGVITQIFFTSAVDGSELSASRSCRFTPWETTHGILGGPQSRSGSYGEEKDLVRYRTPTVQPVAGSYID